MLRGVEVDRFIGICGSALYLTAGADSGVSEAGSGIERVGWLLRMRLQLRWRIEAEALGGGEWIWSAQRWYGLTVPLQLGT